MPQPSRPQPPPTDARSPPPGRGRGGSSALLLLCAATGLMQLNVAAPQVALSRVADDLHADFSALQWVIGGYTLAFAALLMASGGLADRYGRRRVLLVGLGVFNLASVLCAVAPSPTVLVVGRLLQGAGAAAIFPSALAILANETTGDARRRAIAIWGAVIGLTFTAGPMLGGLLVDTVGWRWIFWVSLIWGAVVQLAARRRLRESRDPDPTPVTLEDILVLSAGLFLAAYTVISAGATGHLTAGLLACGVVALVVLVAYLWRQGRRARPLIDTALVRNRTFAGATIVVALAAGSVAGANVYLALYLLDVRDLSPTLTGVVLAPQAALAVIVGIFAGRLGNRLPVRATLATGTAAATLGYVILAFTVDSGINWVVLTIGLAFSGAGIGLANPLTTFVHLAVAPRERSGFASAFNNTARQLGMAFSIAILGMLLQVIQRGRLDAGAGADAAFTHAVVVVLLLTALANLLATVVAVVTIRPADITAGEAAEAAAD